MNIPLESSRPEPLIIEIVGVAGSGKTSLARALSEGHDGWRLDGPLQMRNRRHLAVAARSTPRLGRIAAANLSQRRRLTWKESKYLLYVMEWQRHLSSTPAADHDVIMLDQGPVYVLTRFGTSVVPIAGCEPGSEWWRGRVGEWAYVLDAVIALDAPDPVLWERITARCRSHEALQRGPSAWSDFADSYRRSFATVLAAMESPGGPRVIRYDTNTMSTAQVAEDVADRLGVG